MVGVGIPSPYRRYAQCATLVSGKVVDPLERVNTRTQSEVFMPTPLPQSTRDPFDEPEAAPVIRPEGAGR
ncbi:hypothetical protein GCM10018779_63620 [Streptomyces griseocarneus]|nr:hypothetical protein GCM10018779_63620 [Streptomyces griseocarneus]